MSDELPAPVSVPAIDRTGRSRLEGVKMPSTRLNTALAGLVVAATLAAPAAYAMPLDPVTPAVTRQASDVPPPPSSIAASAAEEYKALRAPSVSQPVADEPSAPGGFDWISAAIGAIAAAGVAIVAIATLATRRPAARRAARA